MAKKGMIKIAIVVSIIFLFITPFQILKSYKSVKEERKEYSLDYENKVGNDNEYKESAMYYEEDIQETETAIYLYYNTIRIVLGSLQICLLLSLILFLILIIICKTKKEIIGKENIAIMSCILFIFIVISFILYTVSWPIW